MWKLWKQPFVLLKSNIWFVNLSDLWCELDKWTDISHWTVGNFIFSNSSTFLFSTQFTFNYIPTHTLTIKHGYHSFSIHFCGDGTPGTRRCYPSLASSTPSSTFCTWTPSCSSPLHSHSSQHHWLPRNITSNKKNNECQSRYFSLMTWLTSPIV